MRKVLFAFGVMGAVLAAEPAAAQRMLPVAVELRGALAFPMGDFGDDAEGAAESGAGFGVDASLSVLPGVSAYAGWSRYSFGNDVVEGDFGGGFDYVDSGFHGGLQVGVPVMLMGVSPWVKGGAVYRELEIDLENDDLQDQFENQLSTDSALGFEAGIGVDIPLGLVISFTPSVEYVSYSPESIDGDGTELDISYLSAGLGMKFRF